MNRTVKNAIKNSPKKVFRIKPSRKLAIGAGVVAAIAAGFVAAKSTQAKKQERSLKSLMVEDVVKRVYKGDKREDESFEESMENSKKAYVLPNAVRKTLGFTELDDFDDTFVLQPNNSTNNNIVFYFHGPNYWYNPSKSHFDFLRRLANKLGSEVILPVYPKAPAHTAVDAHQMMLERYLYLVDVLEIPSENIIFMGDAAGGGMALAMLQKLRYLAMPLPKMAFLFSPWLDVTNSDPKMEDLQADDPILDIEKLAVKGAAYAGMLDLSHPSVSPIFGDLTGLPPITVYSGSREILCADALRLQEIADEQCLDIDVYIFKNQLHFFPSLPIPESNEVFEMIIDEIAVCDEDVFLDEEVAEESQQTEEALKEDTADTAEEAVEEAADEVDPEMIIEFD